MLYDDEMRLVGLLSTHVDDCFCTGKGPLFASRVAELRASFPFGQWISAQEHELKYCGSEIRQSSDFTITMS